MDEKQFVRKPDFNKLSPQLKKKLYPKKELPSGGSFSSTPPQHQATKAGIGSGIKENRVSAERIEELKALEERAKIENEKAEKKALAENKKKTEKHEVFEDLIDACKEHLSALKIKKIAAIWDEPDNICDQLGIEFTDTDIDALIYSGSIEKSIDILKNEKLVATFRSLTSADREKVDIIYNKAVVKNDILVATRQSSDKFKAKHLLAQSLVAVNGEALTGDTSEKVAYINSLSDWVYEHLISTFNLYVFAVNEALTAERIKKA